MPITSSSRRLAGVVRTTLLAALLSPVLARAAPASPVRVADSPPVDGTRAFGLDVVASSTGLLAATWVAEVKAQPGCPSLDQQVYVSVSRDEGRSWLEPVPVGIGFAPRVAWAEGGVLDVVFLRYVAYATANAVHRRSLDAGATWSLPHDVPASPMIAEHGAANPLALSHTPLRLATSPEGSIAVAWRTDAKAGRLTVSHDGGETFDAPQRLVWATPDAPQIVWDGARRLIACYMAEARVICRISTDDGRGFDSGRSAYPESAERRGYALVRRAPGELLLATWKDEYVDAAVVFRVLIARSGDGGARWSKPTIVLERPWMYAPRLGVSALGGEVWMTFDGPWFSVDGTTFTPALFAPCTHGAITALGGGRAVSWAEETSDVSGDLRSFPAPLTRRTADRGATWSAAAPIASYGRAIQDTVLVRADDGRLLGAWLEVESRGLRVRAAASADGGSTWSAPVTVSDAPASRRPDALFGASRAARRLAATALAGGGFAVVWGAVPPEGDACALAEIRASVSADGTSWAPSALLGHGLPESASVVDDGAGTLVAAWGDGTTLEIARSLDRGASWALPLPHGPAVGLGAGPIVRAADGALVLVSADAWGRVNAERSSDGGLTWQDRVQVRWGALRIQLVSAGPRLLATIDDWWCSRWGCSLVSEGFESRDGGRSWWDTSVPEVGPVVAADALGRVFFAPDTADIAVLAVSTPGPGLSWNWPVPGWAAEDSCRNLAAVAPGGFGVGAGAVCFIGADPWAGPPGVLYRCIGTPATLLRDDSTRGGARRPDLGRVFPLRAYPVADPLPGMADPDAGVLADASRPLVVYATSADENHFALVKDAGRIRIVW